MDILLIVDVYGWAWWHKACAIKKYLPYDFKIVLGDYRLTNTNEFDSIHFFDWLGASNRKNVTTSVCSHNHELIDYEMIRYKKELPEFSAITCVSKKLYDNAKRENWNKQVYLCANGVDEEKFYPNKKSHSDKFVVGWVGQKTSGGLLKSPVDIKGFEHVLNPIIEKLKEYDNIELIIHSNNYKSATPHDEMIDLYNKFDLLISTSFLEGTPGPIFEASACGIPVISTNVGCAPELITNEVNGYLIDFYKNKDEALDRVDQFVDKIVYLKNNRDLCKIMGENNRKEIEKAWTWKERSKQWIPVFENHRTK